MRSVSYVQRVSLDFTGTIFPHAICLGDADNDSLNELVVGDSSGKLYIYKNDDCKPWITRTCVGMLTCVGVGDVCNKGRNFVVAVGAEGWFHLFDISAAAAKSDSSSQQDGSIGDEQKPSYTQHIPANTKVMLISDIDGDGRCELVVGYTDRVVRAFRWEEPSDASDLSSGQLVLLKKWLLEGQVDSLSVNPSPEGLPELMVSQPGCGYAILMCSWTQEGAAGPGDENTATPSTILFAFSVGSKDDSSKGGLFALCTLDGTLKLMDSSEKLLWSVQVDHQLFALQKLDVTGDGREEVVACAWDGQTYIIDHARMVVRFQFDENVNAFCAGQYACKDGRNSPCLVYVSFNHKIYVYWRVELERMEPTNLLGVLEERPEYPDLLHRLGVGESVDVCLETSVYITCWYIGNILVLRIFSNFDSSSICKLPCPHTKGHKNSPVSQN
uniref:Integrin alpha FG-GAP repeat containing 2 n=1 Tax=Sinocyclocheilus anshuiensis TaxID=1608454 RepID=A0A671K9A9_9TELE